MRMQNRFGSFLRRRAVFAGIAAIAVLVASCDDPTRAPEFTVTFNLNGGGGTLPAPQTVNAGSSITLPGGTGLSRSGFVFGGWNTAADGTGINHDAGSVFTPTGNVTLFARWITAATFTVTFNANGGTGTVPAQSAAQGSGMTLPGQGNLTRDGHTFGGWNTNAAGTGENFGAGTTFTPASNTTLFARWIVNFTVTFDPNGGTGTVPALTTPQGSNITLPNGAGLSRGGYTFGGWNRNAAGTGENFGAGSTFTPPGDTTLHARWIAAGTGSFTVTFSANGGSGTAPAPQTVAAGSSIALPSSGGLSQSGFTFGGWNTNADGTGTNHSVGASFTPAGNVTLFARWNPVVNFTVTFSANGGGGTVPAPQTVAEGSSITLPGGDGLSRSGFTFGGWNTNAVGTGTNHNAGVPFTPAGNTTLFARWIVNFTVTFDPNGGTGTVPALTTPQGSGITLPSGVGLSRGTYTFGGWNRNAAGTGENFGAGSTFTPTGDTTLHARWIAAGAESFTVTFSANGGGGTAPAPQTVAAGSSIALPSGGGLSQSGFIFGGWNTNADGTGTNHSVGASFTPAGNVTLFARWNPMRVSVSASWQYTVAIRDDGSLWAWGDNRSGQLGDGTMTNRWVPTRIGADNNWASISAGWQHTVAIRDDGSLWAWGDNHIGELGDGTQISRNAPIRIGADNNWASISAGSSHTVAVRDDGSLWAWGSNTIGQLGDGTMTSRWVPIRIGADNNWASASAGWQHTVAIRDDGSLWAWGSNNWRQLGDGTTTLRLIPTRIGVDNNWASISAGSDHTVAVREDGSLWAWGHNGAGQLGNGTSSYIPSDPFQITMP